MSTRTITRADIIDAFVKELDLSRTQGSELLESIIEEMVNTLVADGYMKITSFGSLNIKQKSKRIGRNPKTGVEAVITPRVVVSFRPSHYLRLAVSESNKN